LTALQAAFPPPLAGRYSRDHYRNSVASTPMMTTRRRPFVQRLEGEAAGATPTFSTG
jgi:hypothetical protein